MKVKRRAIPTVGSKYEKKMRNGGQFQMTVVEVEGKVGYRVGKNVFSTPSAAARSVNGGQQVNGWRFWKID
jgi:hypothetical protein